MASNHLLSLLLVGILPLALVALDQCDYDPYHTPGLPSCTDECLKNTVYDGTCGDNLWGMCSLMNGVSSYFSYFGKCLEQDCKNDEERYVFMEKWKEECPTISSVSGVFGNYLTRPSSTGDSTESSSIPGSSSSSSETTSSSSTQTNSPSPTPNPPAGLPLPSPPPPPTSSPSPTEGAPISPNTLPPSSTPSTTNPLQPSTPQTSTSPSNSSSTEAIPPHNHETDIPQRKPHLSIDQIVGYSIGGTLGVALTICAVIYLLNRRHKKNRLRSDSTENQNPYENTIHVLASNHALSKSSNPPPPPPSELHDTDRPPTLPNIDIASYTHPALSPTSNTPSPLSTAYDAHSQSPRPRTPATFPELSGSEYQTQLRATPALDSLPAFRELSGESAQSLSPLSTVSELDTTGLNARSMTGAAGGLPSVAEMDDGRG
ncbi:hypothetical protein DM02DRAFT_727703 [Periconia macrospinosa]|uniref:Extracellular membrane protein CFEM domain-containing protein n=1 Tax=Periconia macrospinosa TaxID=97972 RepID=A0A2V1DUM8_9PLEO|nr:hypothetical protein DM02DRAFT_727703 [Periconia macrospinosa]